MTTTTRWPLGGMLLAQAFALGCPSDDGDDPAQDDGDDEASESGPVDCATADVPTYDEVAIFAKCTMCHSSTLTGDARNGAAVAVNFDTFEAAKASAISGSSLVQSGSMPPMNSGITVTEDEAEELALWAMCGTPP